jgi:hypothetical protein
MKKNLFVAAFALGAFCTQAQNREMYHSVDVSYGIGLPIGDFKNGNTENLSGGNAMTGSAFNLTIHDEIKEFFGAVIKFGYRQNGRREQSDYDFFSKMGNVSVYGDDSWRINHLALGPQVITPVASGITADFYILFGVQWGYVPELDMVLHKDNYSIQYYYSYSPFVSTSGIAGADIRIRIINSISFLVNSEFLFCKPNVEYSEIVSYNGKPESASTIDKEKAVPVNILSLAGGISIEF